MAVYLVYHEEAGDRAAALRACPGVEETAEGFLVNPRSECVTEALVPEAAASAAREIPGVNQPDPAPVEEAPPPPRRGLGHYVAGAIDAARAVVGMDPAREATVRYRLSICQGIPGARGPCHRWTDDFGGRCLDCGCLTKLKSTLASRACPRLYWTAEDAPTADPGPLPSQRRGREPDPPPRRRARRSARNSPASPGSAPRTPPEPGPPRDGSR